MKTSRSEYPWLPDMQLQNDKHEFPLLFKITQLRCPGNAHTLIENALGINRASTHTKRRNVSMPKDPLVSNPMGLCKEDFVQDYYDKLPPDTPNDKKKTWDQVAHEWDALLLFQLKLIDSYGNATPELIEELEATPAYQAKMKNLEPKKVIAPGDYKMSKPAHWSSVRGATKEQEALISARAVYNGSTLVPDRGYDAYMADLLTYSVHYLEDQVQSLKVNVQHGSVSDNFVRALRYAFARKKGLSEQLKDEAKLGESPSKRARVE
jgi:hypothetical protein